VHININETAVAPLEKRNNRYKYLKSDELYFFSEHDAEFITHAGLHET
jgi:hypothetical protein